MKLENILDTRLVELLDQYSDTQDSIGTNLLHIIQNMKNAEVVIPVLGMQGMGKSTLINGLLKENILPNDADETTCVPVEVKYGINECAIVHFFDKESTIIVHTREELNEYVDNNYNPANEKHVACIELFRKNELLQNGMVIVDLPGVGSLTRENENTTKRYVENLCSAIFVIPTIPTIRNKEALFIKSLWSQFSKAIFVQNDWGETKDEIRESMDFNNKVLRNIAEDLHNPYDNDIILVNAYDAISGALNNDQNMVDNSNINALYEKILQLSSNWESERENVLVSRLKLCIEFAKGFILKRLSDIGKSKEEICSENEKKIADFNQGTIEISDKINALKTYLREQEDEVYFIARDKSKECAKKIRAAIYRVIDGGVFDGSYLSSAFADIQEEETKDFTNEIIDVFMNIKFEVESKFDEIQSIEIENELNLHSVEFSSDTST
ncbi:MAG: dynamin family protein, partial [Prevotellaceae bacterium]|nr:dynamin family protein [Candidatus Faecinaster equi]